MGVTYEDIRPEFEQIQRYILGDLDCITEQEHGGNYLAAALITCACDALSYLKYGTPSRGDRFFEELVPSAWRPVTKPLYQAIRNGIVHTYDTKLICIGVRKLDVNISWGQKPHFHLSADEKKIHINIKNLSRDFKALMARYESELKQQEKLRGKFADGLRRSRRLQIPKKDEIAKWEQCLQLATREAT